MQPIAPLMIEHRLIERMIELIRRQIRAMEESNRANDGFIESAIDFIRVYADRTHHGKEEGILFRECERKEMAAGDAKIKKELMEEHAYARGVVGDLADALNKYRGGQKEYLSVMLDKLNALVTFI
jgi:hemerythrin-like domain-containing protein